MEPSWLELANLYAFSYYTDMGTIRAKSLRNSMAIAAFMLLTVTVHAIDSLLPVSPFPDPDILTSKNPLDLDECKIVRDTLQGKFYVLGGCHPVPYTVDPMEAMTNPFELLMNSKGYNVSDKC